MGGGCRLIGFCRKDIAVLEAISTYGALERAKKVAQSPLRMTWKLSNPTGIGFLQILPGLPGDISRGIRPKSKLIWARTHEEMGKTWAQICVRFDTTQVSDDPQIRTHDDRQSLLGDSTTTVKTQRVIENVVFDLQSGGASEVFKIREMVQPSYHDWMKSSEQIKNELLARGKNQGR
jgi:hypothetical protein